MTQVKIPKIKNFLRNHLLWIIILSIVSIVLSGQIEYDNQEYTNTDQVKYRAMAESSPQINTKIIKPFVFRILAPWIAGLLPFEIPTNYFLLNFLVLLSISITLYHLLLNYNIQRKIAFVFTICFLFSRYFYQFYAWNYFQICDTLSLLLLIISFFLLQKKRWILLGAAILIGILIKEIMIVILPTGLAFLYFNACSKKDYIKLALITVVSSVCFLLIRILLDSGEGEGLFQQFSDRLLFSLTPIAIIKKIIIAFTPFGMIPIFFYKETIQFFRSYRYFIVFFVFVFFTTIFGDHERLMTPFAPVYFILISFICQKYLIKNNTAVSNRFLIILVLLSILASFYHLWGLVPLPNRTISTITTAVLSFSCLFSFIILKSTSPKPSS
jgi:hypothetical protein